MTGLPKRNEPTKAGTSETLSREQQLEIAFNNSNDLISLICIEPGPLYKLVSVNKAFLAATGLQKEAVEGHYIKELVPEPYLSAIHSKCRQALVSRELLQWEETTQLQSRRRTGIISLNPIISEQGECTMLLSTVHDITHRKKGEEDEKHVRYLLKERVKELSTLYSASKILQDDSKPAEIALQELVSILPAGWQYPELTEARIITGTKQYKTAGFDEDFESQTAEFLITDNRIGSIEVAYSQIMRREVEGPFLAEERKLINMLAEMLSSYFISAEKKQLELDIMSQKVEEQKRITRAVLNAQENERNKLGQELHDNVNQILIGAKLYLELVNKEKPATTDLIEQSLGLINNAINEIRALTSKEVTPPKKVGLKDIIQSLVDNTNAHGKIKTSFVYSLDAFAINNDLKLNIYRIIQEAINNVLKHADAKNVMLIVESSDDGLHIIIKDDGKGFDPAKETYNGIGISNMLNRVESYNGSLVIDGKPDEGCKIEITIPV